EHPIESRGRKGHQPFGELDHRLVAEPGEHHMFKLVELVLDALIDSRIGVTEYIDPPGAHRIDIAFTVEILEPHAFAAPDGYQRQLLVVLHLRAGVPENRKVALHPAIVKTHIASPGVQD